MVGKTKGHQSCVMNAVNDRKLKREASQYFKFVHEQSQDQITALQY